MELKVNIGYPQVMELVGQLSNKDLRKLVNHIQSKYVLPVKEQTLKQSRTLIQDLILQAPTWTDDEYNNYLETKQHLNQSRLK